MEDIARLAGTARSTVSRALSNSASVSEATRTRIREIARSLNYSVNIGAKNLRCGENRTVGVVVPVNPAAHQPISDPFLLSLIGGLADAVTERGMDMLLTRVDAGNADAVAYQYNSGRAMGIIIIGDTLRPEQLLQLAERRVPIVTWGAQLPGAHCTTVGTDNRKGGALATSHLLEQGCQRIVFLGDRAVPEVAQRSEGYAASLRAAGLPVLPELHADVPFQPAAARAAIAGLVARGLRFDGIVAASDVLAMAAICALAECGLQVPADVLVVGYDDIPESAYFHPPLTTIRQPVAQAGCQLLEGLLQAVGQAAPASRVLPTLLVVRDTSRRR